MNRRPHDSIADLEPVVVDGITVGAQTKDGRVLYVKDFARTAAALTPSASWIPWIAAAGIIGWLAWRRFRG